MAMTERCNSINSILEGFLSKTMFDYLIACPPLKEWEIAAVVYHSWLGNLEKKLAAYDRLLSLPEMDGATAWHIRRLRRKTLYWLKATERDAIKGHIFVARSHIDVIGNGGIIAQMTYSDDTAYFSTYLKAKAYLDVLRKDALRDDPSILCRQSIAEELLDCDRVVEALEIYYLNNDGSVSCTLDRDFSKRSASGIRFLEYRYVDLGDPFSYGDIIRWGERFIGIYASKPTATRRNLIESVTLYAKRNSKPPLFYFDYRDDTDIHKLVLTLDGGLSHDHIDPYDFDRFDGKLPKGQERLLELSQHMKGIRPLSEDEFIKTFGEGWDLPPISSFDYAC
jgi:hypothetical protein